MAIDTLNAMTQGENTIIGSGGYQFGTDNFTARWGDYTMMDVDLDTCQQYSCVPPSCGCHEWCP